mmetsp:Transcript_41606/g.48528  ORF Transcript_41606/g.48528 Transcript_41606/m.48528 type:complete len:132 (+) Transcript_41606:90-485(+)
MKKKDDKRKESHSNRDDKSNRLKGITQKVKSVGFKSIISTKKALSTSTTEKDETKQLYDENNSTILIEGSLVETCYAFPSVGSKASCRNSRGLIRKKTVDVTNLPTIRYRQGKKSSSSLRNIKNKFSLGVV